MMRLRTAEDFYGTEPWNERAENWHGQVGNVPTPVIPFIHHGSAGLPHVVPTDTSSDDEVYAFVQDGRWMVRCPFCPSAQLAYDWDHRFFCSECACAQAGGKMLNVIWPSINQRARIETLLLVRPLANQNWSPPESVAALELENMQNGVG
jgi:hypothetical protein